MSKELQDKADALMIIYNTACEKCRIAETKIFTSPTSNLPKLKAALSELKSFKETALKEWHAARANARASRKLEQIEKETK